MNLVEKMTSEKGELILIVNKFKFSYHKLLQNAFKRFKCTKRGCKAYLRICNQENVVWESSKLNLTTIQMKKTNLNAKLLVTD